MFKTTSLVKRFKSKVKNVSKHSFRKAKHFQSATTNFTKSTSNNKQNKFIPVIPSVSNQANKPDLESNTVQQFSAQHLNNLTNPKINHSVVYGFDYDSFIKLDHPFLCPNCNHVAISLIGSLDNYSQAELDKLNNQLSLYKDYLVINVDDLTTQLSDNELDYQLDYQLFNAEQADDIINFLAKYQYNHKLMVHCNAGVSRTGAVVKSARMFFHYKQASNRSYMPNLLMQTLLADSFRNYRLAHPADTTSKQSASQLTSEQSSNEQDKKGNKLSSKTISKVNNQASDKLIDADDIIPF